MADTYRSFDEIKEPKLRRTIEGLAKLYHNGDVNAALAEYNDIDRIMGTVFVDQPDNESMIAQLRFVNQ